MVIDTNRLVLRRVLPTDLDELVMIHADPELERYMGALTPGGAAAWLARDDESWETRGYGRLAIVERTSERLLGRTGLGYFPEYGEIELGWALRKDAWRNGYATEAAGAAAKWALGPLALPHVISLIDPGNERSIRVAERLGMQPVREDVSSGSRQIVFERQRVPVIRNGR